MSGGSRTLQLAWMICGAMLGAMYLAARTWGPDAGAVNFNTKRLDHADANSIAFIGTSLTGCALAFDPALGDSSQSILRFTQGDAVQEDFVPVLDALLASKSRLTLVEAEMLMRDRTSTPSRYSISALTLDFRNTVTLWLRQLMGKSETNANYGTSDCNPGAGTQQQFLTLASAPRRLRDKPWSPAWDAFVGKAHADGRKVILVSMGRSAALERRIAPAYLAAFEARLEAESSAHGLEVWRFDAQRLPMRDFSDGAHLNASGRTAFTAWLQERVEAARGGN